MDISPEWKERIRKFFPDLQEDVSLKLTSAVDPNYNCLSWALSCNTAYFQNSKGCCWPWPDVPDDTADGWATICKHHGFTDCDSTDFVRGIEKIAIFQDDEGELHATRQDSNGWWKSKLGGWGPDIDHDGLDGLRSAYGSVVCVLQRARPDWNIVASE